MIYRPADLIRELGGPTKAAAFFGVSQATISAWRHRSGKFPAELYFQHQKLLADRGIEAHPGIWFRDLRNVQLRRVNTGWSL